MMVPSEHGEALNNFMDREMDLAIKYTYTLVADQAKVDIAFS